MILSFTKYRKLLAFSGLALISACGGIYNDYDGNNPDPLDRASSLNRVDFAKELLPKNSSDVKMEAKEPPLPKITEVLSAPKAPKIQSNKTISISVTDDIPLKDVFLEISRLADLEIEMGSRIAGGVNFKAKDRPVAEILERICDLAGLRYSVDNGVVRVENDEPYIKTYQASFLNLVRTNKGDMSTSNKGPSASGGSSGGGGESSSGGSTSSGGGGSGSASQIGAKNGGDGDLWAALEKEVTAIAKDTVTKAQPVADATNSGAVQSASENFVTINRLAGAITVKTTAKNHEKITQYLEKVKDYYSAQVLIEAKVVEVSLSDEFKSGVDWSMLTKKANTAGNKVIQGGVNVDTSFPTFSPNKSFAKIDFGGGDLSAVVDLVQAFGTTRTLSSPRITAMNNQQALLSFATNENYFSVKCEVTDPEIDPTTKAVTKPGKLEVSSILNSIPIGVILSLQPSIDTKINEVSLNVRPTLSRLTGKTIQDPSAIICAANAAALGLSDDFIKSITETSPVPQVDVREMDSNIRLKSGEVMAIGGMIDQKDDNLDSGIPWASEIPLLGNAFKNVEKTTTAVQTVIFLKATIVPAYGVDSDDQKFYNKFNTDPRPLKF